MLCESYKSSLEKRKNFIIKAWKFRFLILAALISVVALTVFLGVFLGARCANEIRHISIKSQSATWVYDGLEHSQPEFEITSEKGLYEGHTISVEAKSIREITDSEEEAVFVENVLEFTILDGDGKDVTEKYEIETEWGGLRIKSPVEIALYSLSKQYDGKPLSYEDGDFEILKLPPDVDKSGVSVSIDACLTTVGALSLDGLKENIKVCVKDGAGHDITAENRVDILGDESPLQIFRREIEVTSLSVSRVKGNKPLLCDDDSSAWISLGALAAGHRIEIAISGVLNTNAKSSPNTISSVRIFDEEGNDVTEFYLITLKEGVLSWL